MKSNLKLLIVFMTILATQSGKCQAITNNNVYFELGGAAFFYSVNYERVWLRNPKSNITTRIGVMYIHNYPDGNREISGIPLSISYLKKMKKNYFEVGASYVRIIDTYTDRNSSIPSVNNPSNQDQLNIPSLRIGIRRQPSESGLFWNVLFQGSLLIINPDNSDVGFGYLLPYGSFGIGRAF